MSRENLSSGHLTRSDTNQVVQLLKMARLSALESGGIVYYLYRENKDADQLRDYRTADLHLCFRICKNWVISLHGSHGRHDNEGV